MYRNVKCLKCTAKAEVVCDMCNMSYCEKCSTDLVSCNKQISKTGWTPELILKFKNTGIFIGRGGKGRVFANDTLDSSAVIKLSKSVIECTKYGTEYDIAKIISRAATTLHFRDENATVVKVCANVDGVVDPETNETFCALVMQRVFRPVLEFGSDNTLSYQLYLGMDGTQPSTHAQRGNYIGQKQLLQLVGMKGLHAFTVSSGRLLAFLQYGAKVDANDMEYLLGSSAEEPTRLKIFAVDFDRVGEVTNYQHNIDHLAWSLQAESYFPDPGDDMLYPLFKNAYLTEADKYGYKGIAEQVLERYED